MDVIADLHLHSKYSRAVSPQMVIPEIAKWAKKKGIGLVGTGDWTHPLWLKELQTNLEETAPGIYKVKSTSEVRFLLSTEISSIYSQGGKLRRIHTLFFAPNFQIVEKINEKLRSAGANLMSDGRPMTGLSVKQLAEIVFSVSSECLIVPSHLWTPWFGTYGDKGGFDSLEEAYGEYAKYIYAIETGLSSDPAMNWRIAELDNRSIVSFSDAHSLPKMGREATVFEVEELSFENISKALRLATEIAPPRRSHGFLRQLADQPATIRGVSPRILYTIEFYPEEGKYHFTGHRNCKIKQNPEETVRLGETCPVCGKHLTIGVMHRVQELAGREVKSQKSRFAREARRAKVQSDGFRVKWIMDEGRPPYVMLVPLMEILAEALGTLVGSQKVAEGFEKLIDNFGSEFTVLLNTPVNQIAKISGPKVAEGILRVRSGQVSIDPGYDGVFGTVKIWPLDYARGKPEKRKQMSLF